MKQNALKIIKMKLQTACEKLWVVFISDFGYDLNKKI